MTSNLGCVGLAVGDEAELAELVSSVRLKADALGRVGGVDVVRWEDPSGARLILGVRGDEIVDLLPSFAGSPGALLRDVSLSNDEVANAAVVDETGEQVTALAAEFEERRLLLNREPVSGPACVVALGVDVTFFASAEEFANADASLVDRGADREAPPPAGYSERGMLWPPRMGSESFISFGIFGDGADASAHARLAGTVLATRRLTVALTGQTFDAVRVRTVGFEADLCVPTADHPRTPTPGQIVAGTVFLVASMPDLTWPEPNETHRWRKRLNWRGA